MNSPSCCGGQIMKPPKENVEDKSVLPAARGELPHGEASVLAVTVCSVLCGIAVFSTLYAILLLILLGFRNLDALGRWR